jgi:hypothetical protein
MIDRDILSEKPEDTLAAIQWAKKQKELREKSDALTARYSKTLAPILSANYQKAKGINGVRPQCGQYNVNLM